MPNQSLMGSGTQMDLYCDLEPSCSTQTLTTSIMRAKKRRRKKNSSHKWELESWKSQVWGESCQMLERWV